MQKNTDPLPSKHPHHIPSSPHDIQCGFDIINKLSISCMSGKIDCKWLRRMWFCTLYVWQQEVWYLPLTGDSTGVAQSLTPFWTTRWWQANAITSLCWFHQSTCGFILLKIRQDVKGLLLFLFGFILQQCFKSHSILDCKVMSSQCYEYFPSFVGCSKVRYTTFFFRSNLMLRNSTEASNVKQALYFLFVSFYFILGLCFRFNLTSSKQYYFPLLNCTKAF